MKNVLMEEIRGPSFSCGHIFIFTFSENARMLPFLSAGTLLAKIFIRMDRMAFVEYIVQKNGLRKPFFCTILLLTGRFFRRFGKSYVRTRKGIGFQIARFFNRC